MYKLIENKLFYLGCTKEDVSKKHNQYMKPYLIPPIFVTEGDTLRCSVKVSSESLESCKVSLYCTTLRGPGWTGCRQRTGRARLCSETNSCALQLLCRINSGSGSVKSAWEGMCPGLAVLPSVMCNFSFGLEVRTLCRSGTS